MYYKLVSNGVIVDVVEDSSAIWVVENWHNYSIYAGERIDAKGVASSGDGQVYLLNEAEPFHDYDFPLATLEEIEEVEYIQMKAELDAAKIPVTDDEPVVFEEETEPATQLSLLRKQITELQKEMKEQIERNELLTECLLEMSEVVYSG